MNTIKSLLGPGTDPEARDGVRRRARRSESGAALLVSMVAIMMLSSLSLVYLSNAYVRYNLAAATVAEEKAYQIAEAGLDVAIVELTKGQDLGSDGVGVAAGDLNGGGFVVTMTPEFSGAGEYLIQSVGTYNGVEKTVEMGGTYASPSQYRYAVYGKDWVYLNSAGLVDSYDPSLGSYASQRHGRSAGSNGSVGSGGDITLNSGSRIYGDASALGNLSVTSGSSVSGSTAPLATAEVFDSFVYAPSLSADGKLEVDASTHTLAAGTYRYEELILNSSADLHIDGEVFLFVDGKFLINSASRIIIESGATLNVYHGGSTFEVNSASRILSVDEIPTSFELRSATTDKVELNSSARFYGRVYAPDAEVILNSSSDTYGAIVGRTVMLNSNGEVHYDETLGSGSSGTTSFTIMMTREVK